MRYGYDAHKRLISTGYDSEPTPRYTCDYDASGNIARITDAKRDSVTTYETDFASRPARIQETIAGKHHLTLETSYDSASRVKKVREVIGEAKTSFETEYAYDSEDRVTQIGYGTQEEGITIRYDALNRVTARKLLDGSDGHLINYTYVQGGQGVGSSTSLVESMVQDGESFEYYIPSFIAITSPVSLLTQTV